MKENEMILEHCSNCGHSQLRKNHKICESCYRNNVLSFLEFDNKKREFEPEIEMITDKIYLGNYDAQRDKNRLNDLGITNVLVCGNYFQKFHPNEFTYYVVEIDDVTEQIIIDFFEETYLFIERSFKVFVHCGSGVSRGPSFVIAYLMRKNNWSYDTAFQFVENKRKVINPNPSFISQLKLYESRIFQ
jgi:protein-tyrosine phosphatase/ribosomal protein L32